MIDNEISPQKNRNLGFIITASAALCFGLYPATSKLAYADGVNPTFLIIISTFFRAATLAIAALMRGYSFSQIYRGSLSSLPSGLLQAISILGIICSLQYLSGPVMITVVFTHTLMLLIMMHWRGDAPLTRLALVTSGVALLGISMVVDVYTQDLKTLSLLGLSLAFIAAFATASRIYVFGKQVKELPPEIVGGRAFTYAALFTLILIPFQTPTLPSSLSGYISVTLSCLSLGLGTLAMFYALSLIGAFRLSLTLKLEPIFTCLYSWLILNEVLKMIQYLGIVLVLGSLVVFQLLEQRKERAQLVP